MKQIKVSDYIVEFLISKGVTDVFGYQGGMIAYLFESFKKYNNQITYHVPYNEQGGSFAACGYAQSSGKVGFAFATSGPGFTNMLTGMANAFYDSIPVIFLCGQVNAKFKKRDLPLRQVGFQEVPAAKMAMQFVKQSFDVDSSDQIAKTLLDAYLCAMSGRKGPVYIDVPVNVFDEFIEIDQSVIEEKNVFESPREDIDLVSYFKDAKRPVLIAGGGIKQKGAITLFRKLVTRLNVPVVTTMPGIDTLPSDCFQKIGLFGSIGCKAANYLLSKSDLILSLGSRLSFRQVGSKPELFSPNARIVRIDIDSTEFSRKIHDNEIDIHCDLEDAISSLLAEDFPCFDDWMLTCHKIKELLLPFDQSEGNVFYSQITSLLPNDSNLVFDVGKNQIWGAQSSIIKDETSTFFSAGLGSMGYSLPAAVGAYLGNRHPTFSFNGDGGIQMNIQEFGLVSTSKAPIKIFVLNTHSLSNIMPFQEKYLKGHFVATRESEGDYRSANVVGIASQYGISAYHIGSFLEMNDHLEDLASPFPVLFEFDFADNEPNYSSSAIGPNILSGGKGVPKEIIAEIEGLL